MVTVCTRRCECSSLNVLNDAAHWLHFSRELVRCSLYFVRSGDVVILAPYLVSSGDVTLLYLVRSGEVAMVVAGYLLCSGDVRLP